jgi:hypothetical protein
MGYETDGHLRFTLRGDVSKDEIAKAVQSLKAAISAI